MNLIQFIYFFSYLGYLLRYKSEYEYSDKTIKKIFKKIDFLLKIKIEYVFILIIFLYLVLQKFFYSEMLLYFLYFDIIICLTIIFFKKSKYKFIKKDEFIISAFLLILIFI